MDNNIDFPITSIFVSQVCTYCCLDKDFIKECKKRTESLLETTNNNYFIKDSAFVTMELRKEMLNVLIERKNTKRCSEIGKIYIRKKTKDKPAKTIEPNELNKFLNSCPEKIKEYFLLKYLFLMSDINISACMNKYYFQLDHYKSRIKWHIKSSEYDLIEAASCIDHEIIMNYINKIGCDFVSQETHTSIAKSISSFQSKSFRVFLLCLFILYILFKIFWRLG